MDRTTVDSTMHGSDLATSSSSSWPVGLFRPKKQHKSFSPPAQAIVLYTFKARPGNSDELSIERGEHVNVYYQTQGGWSGCTSSSGSAGTVPSSYIKLIEGEEMNEVDPNFYNTTSTRTTTDGDATSTHHIQPPSSSPPRGFKKQDRRRSSKLSTYAHSVGPSSSSSPSSSSPSGSNIITGIDPPSSFSSVVYGSAVAKRSVAAASSESLSIRAGVRYEVLSRKPYDDDENDVHREVLLKDELSGKVGYVGRTLISISWRDEPFHSSSYSSGGRGGHHHDYHTSSSLDAKSQSSKMLSDEEIEYMIEGEVFIKHHSRGGYAERHLRLASDCSCLLISPPGKKSKKKKGVVIDPESGAEIIEIDRISSIMVDPEKSPNILEIELGEDKILLLQGSTHDLVMNWEAMLLKLHNEIISMEMEENPLAK
ncbi:hypothetical protein ADUPG1_007223 [Aduncisulcus paluster]|uniref:SH3 domain-containing protein n=1 Tax=Aduncisulcus paluster TaxID=2918883 RepID=A0ABQ5KL61_9EUKA|nr:hypothetical protein ADUPG1_007223 [Aduncisulcus paluster]